MIDTVDKNGDGKISFSEFRSEPDFDRDNPLNLDLGLFKPFLVNVLLEHGPELMDKPIPPCCLSGQ